MKQYIISLMSLLCVSMWCALAAPAFSQGSAGYSIMHSDVEANVSTALQSMGAGDTVIATLTQKPQGAFFTHHARISLDIENLDFNARKETWTGEAHILSHGNIIRRFSINGTYETKALLPVLNRTISRGEVITERDIEMITFPEAHITGNTILDSGAVVGMAAKRTIMKGRMISRDYLEAPILVKRGAAIQMFYKTPFMEIKALGEALENGAKGELIRARNSESGMTVRGVVKSEDRIVIQGGSAW